MNAGDLPYNECYRLHQRHLLATEGLVGPIWPMQACHVTVFLSLMARRVAFFHLPKWPRPEVAAFLYRSADIAGTIVKSNSRLRGIRQRLSHLLRGLGLPLVIPVVRVPAGLGVVKGHQLVRACLHRVLGGIRCEPARLWIQRQVRVQYSRHRRWQDRVNGNRAFREAQPVLPRLYAGMPQVLS